MKMPSIPGVGGPPGGKKISKDALLITGGGIVAAFFLWQASKPTAPTPVASTTLPTDPNAGAAASSGAAIDNGTGTTPPSVIGQSGAGSQSGGALPNTDPSPVIAGGIPIMTPAQAVAATAASPTGAFNWIDSSPAPAPFNPANFPPAQLYNPVGFTDYAGKYHPPSGVQQGGGNLTGAHA
jgi:hypothetical protein